MKGNMIQMTRLQTKCLSLVLKKLMKFQIKHDIKTLPTQKKN